MKLVLGPLAGLALLTASPAPAALVYYELTLTPEADYTAFGGGNAGEPLTGLFWFDDTAPTGPGPPSEPNLRILPSALIFYEISIGTATFSSSEPGSLRDNALLFDSGELADVFFNMNNPDGDHLEVSTVLTEGTTSWEATEAPGGPLATAGATTLPDSVQFMLTEVPEPTSGSLAVLGSLLLLLRRRRQAAGVSHLQRRPLIP